MNMRQRALAEIGAAAHHDSRIWFLTGDLGRHVVEPFQQTFPARFLNVGVAEQTMVGLAAGLALAGKIPVVYSIGNFLTLRALEQVRNDVVHHRLPVKFIGVGRDFTYGTAGFTHWCTEDADAMRLVGVKHVYSPTLSEVPEVVLRALAEEGPSYIRLT